MATEKFSEFTAASSCDSTDRIVGYNGSDNLKYTPEQIANNIGDGVVTAAKLATSAVTTAKILDANVTTAKIADGAITQDQIADDEITTDKLQDDVVTTAKILDANVTTAKLADSAVTAAKIANSTITPAKLSTTVLTKKYVALITQSNGVASGVPQVVVLFNNFVGAISYSKASTGNYGVASANSEFTTNKTAIGLTAGISNIGKFVGASISSTSAGIISTANNSATYADGQLNADLLVIEVYP